MNSSRGNRLEEHVQEFWKVSRAWKRDPEYAEGQTFQTIIDRLRPLYIQGEFHKLRDQAENLSELVIHGKIRRKKGTIKGRVVRVNFGTQNSGHRAVA